MKRAVFRVDGAPFIGIGHIMRCLTLAEKLRSSGWDVQFICRDFENNYVDTVKAHGFLVSLLPRPENRMSEIAGQVPPHAHWLGVDPETDAQETLDVIEPSDLLVVDHYGIDARWHKLLRPSFKKILVIDDLADRALNCDYVLDQTYGRDPKDYKVLAPSSAVKLCGRKYMLLRDCFAKKRAEALVKRSEVQDIQNVFICMGSGDPENTTGLVLQGLNGLKARLKINIILSSKAEHLKHVQYFESRHEVHVYTDHDAVEGFMIEADIAFGAGGTMSWERCCLGLPTLLMVLAENQRLIADTLAQEGAVLNLGWHKDVSPADIETAFSTLISDIPRVKMMSVAASAICDGSGANRVLEKLDDH